MIQINRNEYDSDKPDKLDATLSSSEALNIVTEGTSKHTSTELSIKISYQFELYSVIIFKFSGSIMQSSIPHLRSIVHAHIINIQCVIFELKQVAMISSAGWGFLIAENKRLADEQRMLFLADFQPDLYQVYESLQLHLIMRAYSTIAECFDFLNLKSQKITTPSITKGIEQPKITQPSSISFSNEYLSKPILSAPAKQICYIISTHGPCSFFKLLSILQTKEFSTNKIGPLKLRSLLKDLDLDSFEKRERYFRSC